VGVATDAGAGERAERATRFAAGASTIGAGASTTGAGAGADAVATTVFFATDFLEGEAVELIVLDAGRVFILLLRTDFIIKPTGSVNFYFFSLKLFLFFHIPTFSFEIGRAHDVCLANFPFAGSSTNSQHTVRIVWTAVLYRYAIALI